MIAINRNLCDCCGSCIGVCPESALLLKTELTLINNICTGCGICIPLCPTAALKPAGSDQ